jgi:hypothetical protein
VRVTCWIRLVLAGLVLAQAAQAETIFSAYFGHSSTQSSDLEISQAATDSDAVFEGVHWDANSFEDPLYYGARLTHYLETRQDWGIALDFVHYKIYARTADSIRVRGRWNGAPTDEVAPMQARVQSYSISHGVNFLGALGLYRGARLESAPYPRGRLQPYLGIGPVYYIIHPENRVNDMFAEGYETSGWGWQALAGLRFALTTHIDLFGEAKYDHGRAMTSVAGEGRSETSLDTLHAVVGVGFTF